MIPDVQTTILMIFLVYVVLHGAIWFALANRDSFQVKLWCASGMLSGLAVVFFANIYGFPLWVSYYLAQMMMLLGNLGRLYALRMYLPGDHRIANTWSSAFVIVYMAIFTYLDAVLGKGENFLLNYYFSMWVLGVLDYIVIGQQLNRRYRILGARLVLVAGLVFTITLAIRALGFTMGWGAQTVYEPKIDQVFLILGQIVAITLSNIGFLQIYLHIEEQKKIEMQTELIHAEARTKSLQEYGERLQELLNEREEMLRHLAQSNKSAGMGALAGIFAHELNQPLAAIQLNAQLMQKKMAQGEIAVTQANEIIADLIKDNRRAAEIIRKIRVIFEQPSDAFAPVDLTNLVRDTTSLVELRAKTLGVKLELQLAPATIEEGDATQLQQVVLNLLNNALDAHQHHPKNREESPFVQVQLLNQAQQICLQVIDNGPGISEEFQKSLFQLYKTSKVGGMGIGLWLSKTIIENHRGHIEFESRPGFGTRFTVDLPKFKQS